MDQCELIAPSNKIEAAIHEAMLKRVIFATFILFSICPNFFHGRLS